MAKKKASVASGLSGAADYGGLLADISSLLETARCTSAQAVVP